MKSYKELKKNLKVSIDALNSIDVGLIGDSSTQLLHTAIKGHGIDVKLDYNIYEADYDMIEHEVFNITSELYSHKPEVVILAPSTEKLLLKFQKTNPKELTNFAKDVTEIYRDIYSTLSAHLNCKIILFNFPWINEGVFGHFSNSVKGSFSFQLRKLNYLLMEMSVELGNLFIFDVAAIQNTYGISKRFEPKFFVNGKMVYSLDILPILAKELTDIILSVKGIKLNKCLILDLDNTIWGGVIGDDGMEGIEIGELGIGRAFTDLQLWALSLKARGIILCVCSKNTESIAKEPFERHPDMVLSLDDISVFVANWKNKADNIRHIKEILNIGFDSMVFLDDNPFERNLIRQEIPEVTVPELPMDPAEYISFIRRSNLFETASFSKEDNDRTKRYQEEAKRVTVKSTFKSLGGYLESLEMKAEVESFDKFSVPRVAQLTQRSNQFNLRTIRYTEGEIEGLIKNDNFLTMKIKLSDKYGDYGLISVVIGEIRNKNLFVDTWIMSCRVLKRDVEKFVLNELVTQSKKLGLDQIVGERLPTPKNIIVKDHYKDLGFSEKEDLWYLDLSNYVPLECFITNHHKEGV